MKRAIRAAIDAARTRNHAQRRLRLTDVRPSVQCSACGVEIYGWTDYGARYATATHMTRKHGIDRDKALAWVRRATLAPKPATGALSANGADPQCPSQAN
jgi:hypothetical protein